MVNSTDEEVVFKEGTSLMGFGKISYRKVPPDGVIDPKTDLRESPNAHLSFQFKLHLGTSSSGET